MISLGRVRGKVRGFTLVELLVAITVLAVLASIATPNINQMLARRRMQTAAFELQSSIQQARSFAANYGRAVEMRPAYNATAPAWNTPVANRTSINIPNTADVSKATLDDAKLSWYVVTPSSATLGANPISIEDSTNNGYPVQVSLADQTLITATSLPASATPTASSGILFFPTGYMATISPDGTTSKTFTSISFRVCDSNSSEKGIGAGYTVYVGQFGTVRTLVGDPQGGTSC